MTYPMPADVGFGLVKGKFGWADITALDDDGLPDLIPATNLVITFIPKVNVLIDTDVSDPVSIGMRPIVCAVDGAGYLIDPRGQRGIHLIATNDTDLNPTGWVYSVTFRIDDKPTVWTDIPAMSLLVGETVDLTLVQVPPGTPPLGLTEAEMARDLAIEAAGIATAAASTMTDPEWIDVQNKPDIAYLNGSGQISLSALPVYAVIRIGNGGVTVPVRPAYPGPVDFWCSTEPPRTGTTAGGTAAAAPGDGWLQAPAP